MVRDSDVHRHGQQASRFCSTTEDLAATARLSAARIIGHYRSGHHPARHARRPDLCEKIRASRRADQFSVLFLKPSPIPYPVQRHHLVRAGAGARRLVACGTRTLDELVGASDRSRGTNMGLVGRSEETYSHRFLSASAIGEGPNGRVWRLRAVMSTVCLPRVRAACIDRYRPAVPQLPIVVHSELPAVGTDDAQRRRANPQHRRPVVTTPPHP